MRRITRQRSGFQVAVGAVVASIALIWLAGGMTIWAFAATLVLVAVIAAASWRRQPSAMAEAVPAAVLEREPERVQAEPPAATLPSPAKPDTSWRAAVGAMPDPALALDGAGVIVHHNPAAADLFPRVRMGQPLSSVIRSPELLAAIEKARNAEDIIVVELQDRVPVQRRVSAILTTLTFTEKAEGGPTLLVTFRDITDQEKLAQMRADFIAHASHELRTPLASLRGFVETLQGPARDDAAARERFLGIMAVQAERMTRLIDDLLSLSRIEMRVHVPPRGVVDLNEVVEFVAQALEPVARSAGITIAAEPLPDPARVRGDREELVQVFQNLMQNGIRYGRLGGHVTVRIAREAGRAPWRLFIAVEDDGQGIPAEHLPRLTERFYRVSASASREKGGTGLGLAIVKHIITRHRGELRITSTLGKGSKFTVILDELAAPPIDAPVPPDHKQTPGDQ